MTPEEKAIYMHHFFDLGDRVIIGESDVIGEITGMQIADGQEDSYRVSYLDATGSPHESWWRSSLLESADDEADNVVQFPCACERADIAAARNATKH